jgi:MFS family permease
MAMGELVRLAAKRPAATGLGVLACANLLMVATMTVAPVHMRMHGEGLGAIGAVIALHVAGMFGPSPLSGRLADRAGPVAPAAAGLMLTALAGMLSVLAVPLPAALLVLGVGWNFAVVGGSMMITRAAPEAGGAALEGLGEAAMGVAAGVGGPIAGAFAAVAGYQRLSAAIAVVALVVLAAGCVAWRGEVPSFGRSANSIPLEES